MRKHILWVVLLLSLTGTLPVGAASFASHRLELLASSLRLNGLDGLSEGTHHGWRFRNHDLVVRVDAYGEVGHVGLLLFSSRLRQGVPEVLCDFLERTLLERLTDKLDEAIKFKLHGERLFFLKGDAQAALQIDTLGSFSFSTDRIDFRTYQVCWGRDGQEILKLRLNMDYQMLSGCDALELDARFIRRLRRFKPHRHDTKEWHFPQDTQNVFVAQGDTFLIREFSNSLYYECSGGEWKLLNSPSPQDKVLRNMMLSLDFSDSPLLTVSYDKHSDENGQLTLPYRHWLQMCMDEGCTPFFGIRQRTDTAYKGTLLMVNPAAGYIHLLSVSVPTEVLHGNHSETIRGVQFLYIPMHNVSKDYFKH